jgi:hypothetical protein
VQTEDRASLAVGNLDLTDLLQVVERFQLDVLGEGQDYVRNPPGSRHTPGASEGCMIFVRLRQFHSEDREQLATELNVHGDQLLFENRHERVWIQAIQANARIELSNPRGLELLVLDGAVAGEDFLLQPLSWMRLPPGMPLEATAGTGGARLWVKDAAPDLGI